MSDALQDVQDRFEIQDVLFLYADMVDRRQWEKMDEVFAPDATLDYRSSGGIEGPYRSTLEWLGRALAPWPLNLHHVSNVRIELAGDRARSSCYFHAPMGRVEPDGSQHFITNAGYYHDEWVRTSAGWRIQHRVCEQPIMIGALPEGYEIPQG